MLVRSTNDFALVNLPREIFGMWEPAEVGALSVQWLGLAVPEPMEAGLTCGERSCQRQPHLAFACHFYNGALLLWQSGAVSTQTPGCRRTTLQPLQAVFTQPRSSPPWVCPLNPNFNTQSPPVPADICLRFGCTRQWHECVGLSLCSTCHTLVVLSEPLKLSFCPG